MQSHGAAKGTLMTYITGFVLSVLLTLIAYQLVVQHVTYVVTYILALAVIQLIVQLVFFLHVGKGSSGRWNTIVLLFAALVVVIVVLGSIWIMNNLHYNMLRTPSEVQHYINSQDGL